jgi:hypothetical protein
MTNENFSYIQFFPVNFTGSQTENRSAFGQKNPPSSLYTKCDSHGPRFSTALQQEYNLNSLKMTISNGTCWVWQKVCLWYQNMTIFELIKKTFCTMVQTCLSKFYIRSSFWPEWSTFSVWCTHERFKIIPQ